MIELIRRNKNFWAICITFILIRVVIDYLYLTHIQPSYAYWGYKADPTIQSYTISYLMLFCSFFLIKNFFEDTRFVVCNMIILLYLIDFIPTTSIIALDPQPITYSIYNSIYWFLILFVTDKKHISNISFPHITDNILVGVGLFFSLIVVYISGTYANFRFTISLEDVYVYRESAREFHMPRLLGYAWAASRLVLPLIVSFCLVRKKYIFAVLFTFVVILNFSIDGMKSVLGSLIICVLLFVFVKKAEIRKLYPYGLLLLAVIALAEFYYNEISFVSDFIIRRNLYIPAIIDTKFYDLIYNDGPVFWSYTYKGKDIAFYIGDVYFNHDGMRANNGMFCDAYMNIGLLGCIIYPFIYAYIFNIADSLLKYSNRGLLLMLCLMWAYKMRGATITTVLLTHGIAVALLVLALLPPDKRLKRIKNV